jgi:unsaturated rhamnogalacturonyl hydrolase
MLLAASVLLSRMNPLLRLAPISVVGLGLLLAGGAVLQAKVDFGPWPAGASPLEVGKRVAERFVVTPHGNVNRPQPPKIIIYPETCTWYGALTFAQLTGDKDLAARLAVRFEPLFGPEASLIPEPINVDYTVFGTVPLELFIQTKDARYLKIGQDLADKQWEKPADNVQLSPEAREGLAAGLTWHTRFWIDDMYMITMVQTQAFRATGDAKYLDRAAREAVAYLDKLQQPNGLFYHAPDVPFFWGRGDGWFAAGMSELLRSLPDAHPNRARILAGYQKMMATLLKHQDANGMWHQLIDHPESWPESSCTGMFTFAFISGVKNGWLDEKAYGPAARKGWLALVSYLDADAAIREVCEGTNKKNDLQYYLDRKRNVGDLHGQAPVVWCASALLR